MTRTNHPFNPQSRDINRSDQASDNQTEIKLPEDPRASINESKNNRVIITILSPPHLYLKSITQKAIIILASKFQPSEVKKKGVLIMTQRHDETDRVRSS
jgi:hypothetical protein